MAAHLNIFSPRLLQITTSRLVASASATSTISHLPIISASNVYRRGMASVATAEATPREARKPRLKTFEIYRWNPDTPEKKPEMVKYQLDLNQTVCSSHYMAVNGGWEWEWEGDGGGGEEREKGLIWQWS